MSGENSPADDVVEAIADALLAASAAAIIADGREPTFPRCLDRAQLALGLIALRTAREGARPRVPEAEGQ